MIPWFGVLTHNVMLCALNGSGFFCEEPVWPTTAGGGNGGLK